MREKLISDECYGLISKPDFILSFFIKTRHGNSPQSVHGFYHVFSCNVYKITYKYTVYIYLRFSIAFRSNEHVQWKLYVISGYSYRAKEKKFMNSVYTHLCDELGYKTTSRVLGK